MQRLPVDGPFFVVNDSIDLLGLLIAAAGGTAVGLERQRSGHADGPGARFAGIRTFTMLGVIGGLSGALWNSGLGAPAVVLLSGGVAITAAAYFRASRREIDGTTEVAAVVVMAAGVLAGAGAYRVAGGIIALTSLLLIEKSRLHELAARIDDVGLRAGIRFAVLALVVLPVLPEGPYGPLGGIRPRELWALVLFFSGLSFVAYIARSIVGTGHGYLVAGLLGGVASSTNATFTFARTSRHESSAGQALAFGAVAANAVLYPRVLIATAVLNLPLLAVVLRYLAAPALVAVAGTMLGAWQSRSKNARVPAINNPLQLGTALQMVLIFQAVLMVVHAARTQWGASGIWSSAALAGLTDVDALTATMARGIATTNSLQVAGAAIAIGVLSNTALKLALALVLGSPTFRKIAGAALFLMAVASAATLWFLMER